MMNVKCWIVVVLALLLADWRIGAQSLSEGAEQKARDLLRDTVKARETPKPAPIYASTPVPPPAAPMGRELAPTGKPGRPLNYAELEQAYLSGKITARQFQKALANGMKAPAPIVSTGSVAIAVAREPSQPVKAGQGTTTTPEPAATVNAEDPSPIADVENKMDELLRLKAAREQAAAQAAAAAASTNTAAGPKSKREQMDDLIKLYVAGKISEADYKAKREKLIGE